MHRLLPEKLGFLSANSNTKIDTNDSLKSHVGTNNVS